MKILLLFTFFAISLFANDITINAGAGHKDISPYIFGLNNSLSDNKNEPESEGKSKLWNNYSFFEKKKISRKEVFDREINQNHKLGIAIMEYFGKLEIPIDFYIKKDDREI